MFTEDLLRGSLSAILLWIILFNTILWTKEYGYLYFPDEEAEASNIKVTMPKANLLVHWNWWEFYCYGHKAWDTQGSSAVLSSVLLLDFRSCETGLGPALSSRRLDKCLNPMKIAGARYGTIPSTVTPYAL